MLSPSVLAASLVTSLASATCTMPSGDITRPETWGDYFLDKYAAERAEATSHIEVGPAPLAQPRTVLLITGVTIPAEWFDPIVLRLQRDGFRPVVWEPPALLSGDLVENSRRLAQVVDEIRAQTGEERIDILAECTGGLLARHYIQSLGGDAHVSRMITFISPQNGLPKAALAHDLVGWPALEDLTPGSVFLETVNNAPLPEDVAVTSIYTCTDEYIQPYKTSIIPGAKNIGLCDEFVGHFQFFYDPEIYLLMHGELTRPAPSDPVGQPDPDPTTPAPTDDETNVNDGAGCSAGSGGTSVAFAFAIGAIVLRRPSRRKNFRATK